MSAYVVGLTGGIGSGKSTVADLFAARGVAVVDTDCIARELTAAGGAAMPELMAAFGADIAAADGSLDREAMRRRALADPAQRQRLEAILHPAIRQLSRERCRAAASPYALLVVPLLVESGNYRERCDRVLVVDCDEARQVARVMARSGLAEGEVRAFMAAQAPRAARLAAADDVVANDDGPEALVPQVAALHRHYLGLAAAKAKASC